MTMVENEQLTQDGPGWHQAVLTAGWLALAETAFLVGEWGLTNVASMQTARRHMAAFDAPWSETVALLTSEFHTNAITHNPETDSDLPPSLTTASATAWRIRLSSLGRDAALLTFRDQGNDRLETLAAIAAHLSLIITPPVPGIEPIEPGSNAVGADAENGRGLWLTEELTSRRGALLSSQEVCYWFLISDSM